MKKNKILKISILVLSIVAIFLLIGITYAYFASTHQDDEDNILASSCFNLELTANNILSEGNIPMTDDDAKTLTPYSFTIKNTCGTPAEVGINLDILKTTNATLSNYKVSLSNGASLAPTLINDLESDEIANDDTLLTKKLTSVYIAGKNEKTIELRLWMKDSVGVGEGENEIIESKISLTATAVSVQYNPVQEKIIADNGGILKVRGKKDINLKEISPSLIYEENEPIEDATKTTIRVGLKRKYSDSYTFNPEGGIYTLNNPVSEVLSEKHIGMYTCKNTTGTCTTLYKVKEADINPASEGYSVVGPTEKSLNVTSTVAGNRTFGKSYTRNQTNGNFVLSEVITNGSFTEDYIGYYVCSTSATSISSTTLKTCTYLHQIVEVQADPGEGKFYSKETLNATVSFTSASNKTVSATYNFDNETGTFTLTNPESSITYSNNHIGYYTCNTDTTTCTTLYKINEVTDSTVTKVDQMVKTTRYNRLKKSNVYQKVTNNSYITLTDKYTTTPVDYVRKNTGLYVGEDDFGETYYFRGTNDYNNLFFAGYYWNIVRINGDGSLRIIYRGSLPTVVGEESKIKDSAYNGAYNSNSYVGYMYGSSQSLEYKFEHANKYNSNIKSQLDIWYKNNLLTLNDYIADSIFCNDRSLTGSGYGNSSSYYNGYYRTRSSNNLTPSFKCLQKNDRFTVSNTFGNLDNKNPIGLLTTDEAGFAGLYNTSTSTYNYLNTGIDYWTMTPSKFSSSAYVNYITSTGAIGEQVTNTSMGVRPVINLKGNVILSGTGTLDDPYRVEGLKTE